MLRKAATANAIRALEQVLEIPEFFGHWILKVLIFAQ